LRSEAPSCGWHTIAAEVPAQNGSSSSSQNATNRARQTEAQSRKPKSTAGPARVSVEAPAQSRRCCARVHPVFPNRSCSKRVPSCLCSRKTLREPLKRPCEVVKHRHVSWYIGDGRGKPVTSCPQAEMNRGDFLWSACDLHCCAPSPRPCLATKAASCLLALTSTRGSRRRTYSRALEY
jgi:hypothetical protein